MTAGRVRGSRAVRVTCDSARSAPDLDSHFEIRRTVFVTEQHVFPQSDRDEQDDGASTVHVLGRCGGRPAGAVRLFPVPAAPGVWQGDRLCVLPEFRTCGLGGPLVRYAVAAAGASGGATMVAHIQVPNVAFFERLGWLRDGDVETYIGLPHQPMRIALPSPHEGRLQMHEWSAD